MPRFRIAYYSLTLIFLATSNLVYANKLPSDLSALLKKYQLPEETVSIDIRNISTKRPTLQFNADKLMNPASVMKVVTTMAALDLLGPTYTWETQYYYTGKIDGSTLKGDLILVGGGDPFLTEDRLWQHIRSIKNLGITHIEGDLVIDNTKFQLPRHDRAAFDGQGNRLYNVGPDAALINFSATQIRILPFNNKPVVFAEPALDNLIVENKLALEDGKCINKENGWSIKTEKKEHYLVASVEGKYRASCGEFSLGRALLDNLDYTHHIFKGLWQAAGGTGLTSMKLQRMPDTAQFLIAHGSLPLSDIITSINKWSNNVMTQQLLLTMGGEHAGFPATFASGIAAVRSWIKDKNLDIPGLIIENGSGLSRIARVSSKGLGNLLDYAWKHSFQPEFMSSLPITAIDGTMRRRLKKHPLAGQARLKTGYLNNTRSMAGYVRGKNGQQYSVVMTINSDKVDFNNGNVLQDALLKWIYDL